MLELDDESRQAFLADLGLTTFSRDRVVRDLFYAVAAAGAIPKGLSERFVRANVIGYADFESHHFSEKECKLKGLERTEGKTYVVKDADVLHILASS